MVYETMDSDTLCEITKKDEVKIYIIIELIRFCYINLV
jgi:hypothetical protein